jgi:23S rRNA (cytosine1962-C5)-methyltransferase
MLPPLRLKKNEDRRLRAGHLWVFSNEVDVARTPLTAFEPGSAVEVQDARGVALGAGYVNPRSLIAARLVSRDPTRALDGALLRERIVRALALRERLFARPFYRLVFGEGDGLPGLVADRFGELLVLQLTTAGVDRLRDEVVAAFEEILQPAGILLRNDAPGRELEGLERSVQVAAGSVPAVADVEENGVRFRAPLAGGQKTGWFYDHRMNRARLAAYAPGRRVLDVFSYLGGWGVQAAAAGAREVLCVDSSETALEGVRENAALNGVEDRVGVRRGDAFEVLRALGAAGERWDVVVLDPPAFIKRKKDVRAGEEAYRRLAQLGMEALAPEGVLISASCSFHFGRQALGDALLRAGRRLEREVQFLEMGGQGPDHPVHPAIPETSYLKAIVARVG